MMLAHLLGWLRGEAPRALLDSSPHVSLGMAIAGVVLLAAWAVQWGVPGVDRQLLMALGV